jgi:general secretion pathway protein A
VFARKRFSAYNPAIGFRNTMHKNFFSFFGLRENPFNVNPDPRYLVLTRQIRESLDELTYGIQARRGLMLLTGEAGTGKTTLINQLLDWLHQRGVTTAFIFNPHLEVSELFDFMLADFGIPSGSRRSGTALMCLNRWLLERHRAGECPILIVDEAQGLPSHVLEEIRMLVNLETPHQKLLQIVLSGQPEFEEKLNRPDLRPLRQRIALRCKTSPLTLEEAHNYVRTRLSLAGAKSRPNFTSEALDAIHLYSGGVPRLMNLLCEHALIKAFLAQIELVPAHMVEQVACKYQLDSVKPVSLSGISSDATSENVIAMESLLARISISPSAALDSASMKQPRTSIRLGTSAGSDEGPARNADEEATTSAAKSEEAPTFHRSSDAPIIMRTPVHPLTAVDKAKKTHHPNLNSLDSASLDQLVAEFGLDSRPPSSASILRAPDFRRRTWLYKLEGARWPHLQTILSVRRELHRRWSGWRDKCWSLVAILAWQNMEPFLARWLRQPARRAQRSEPNPHIHNLPRRAARSSTLPARLLNNRSWVKWQNGPLRALLQPVLRHINASFRWLQRPMGFMHHRHGSGI